MTKKLPPSLADQLCFAMYSASLAMTKFYKPRLAEIGLTYPQYLVLLVLWEEDQISLKDLAERLLQDSGALTPVVKRLETSGLLKRLRSASDERSLRLTLTPAGRRLWEKVSKVDAALTRACAMPGDEIAGLHRQAVVLRERLLRAVTKAGAGT